MGKEYFVGDLQELEDYLNKDFKGYKIESINSIEYFGDGLLPPFDQFDKVLFEIIYK